MKTRDALVIVDVQNDFCPGGALPVQEGDEVVAYLNRYISFFKKAGHIICATRDWHPEKTAHFKEYGGRWPPHCVQGTPGAMFHPSLKLPHDTVVITKGAEKDDEGYSGFQGKDAGGRGLGERLRAEGVTRIFIGGLATDYCVRATALDAVKGGFKVCLLKDAVKGVDVAPGDSIRAMEEMKLNGVEMATLHDLQVAQA